MKIPILFSSSREPKYRFSYAIGCYPTLGNPQLTKSPLSELYVPSIKEKLKEPDEIGRFQVLGIYQHSINVTEKERAEQLRNERYIDLVIKEGGKINPMFGFDHLHRDLILVAYEDTNEDEFQQRVKKKLSKKEFEKRDQLLGTLKEVTTKLVGRPIEEKKQTRNMSLEEHMKLYFRMDDTLERLSIHHIDNLPDVLQKDTSFIRDFYRKVQGKNLHSLGGYLEEAERVVEKAEYIRNTYGLTRDEIIPLEGSADNIIASLKGEQGLQKIKGLK